MITRLLKPEESWIWSKVMAVAFEYGLDIKKAKEEAEKEKTPEELEKAAKDRCFASFADDNTTVYGCVLKKAVESTCDFYGRNLPVRHLLLHCLKQKQKMRQLNLSAAA